MVGRPFARFRKEKKQLKMKLSKARTRLRTKRKAFKRLSRSL